MGRCPIPRQRDCIPLESHYKNVKSPRSIALRGDFTLFQVDAEMYFKAKYEKREFHKGHNIRVNVYV